MIHYLFLGKSVKIPVPKSVQQRFFAPHSIKRIGVFPDIANNKVRHRKIIFGLLHSPLTKTCHLALTFLDHFFIGTNDSNTKKTTIFLTFAVI